MALISRILSSLIFFISLLANAQVNSPDRLYKLKAGNLVLQVDAGHGARIISLQLSGEEVLSTAKVHPENFGSTLWLSPQTNWGWPPYQVLDSKPYQTTLLKHSVCLTSMPDSMSGCSVSKMITANSSDTSFTILYTIINISAKPKKVAPWEVNRVPTGGFSFFPLGEKTGYQESDLPAHDFKGLRRITYTKETITKEQKMFHDGREGWLAHLNKGILFIKKFPDFPASEAAPKEAEVEIYVHDLKSYIELENQGKYQTLLPGQKLEWEVKWFVRKLPPDFSLRPGDSRLVNYVRGIVERRVGH